MTTKMMFYLHLFLLCNLSMLFFSCAEPNSAKKKTSLAQGSTSDPTAPNQDSTVQKDPTTPKDDNSTKDKLNVDDKEKVKEDKDDDDPKDKPDDKKPTKGVFAFHKIEQPFKHALHKIAVNYSGNTEAVILIASSKDKVPLKDAEIEAPASPDSVSRVVFIFAKVPDGDIRICLKSKTVDEMICRHKKAEKLKHSDDDDDDDDDGQVSPPSHGKEPDAKVKATLAWQGSGISVKKGQTVVIKSITGNWTLFAGQVDPFDARGSEEYCNEANKNDCCEPLPLERKGALIGKIADQVFLVGTGGKFTAKKDGKLAFRMNDCNIDLDDNEGILLINTIKVN